MIYRLKLPTLLLIFTLFCTAILEAQPSQRQRFQGSITGTLVDSVSGSPVEYANIILYSDRDSTQVDGTITNESGTFILKQVRPGQFFLEIRFIGFADKIIENVAVSPQNGRMDLGTIYLTRAAINSEGVVVEGTTPAVEYKIDRKVIDVSQQTTAASGSAVDILENVPSVRVDIEGNVSLRGSGSFTVLIDGKPTVLEGSDALEQIPVSSIANIEIITNPSAKYDPEGTAGIINVVLKKKKFTGSSGMLDLMAGLDDKYGGNGLYHYKTDTYTLTFNLDYRQRFYDGTIRRKRETTYLNRTNYIDASGSAVRGGERQGIRAAFEYNFSPKSQLTLNTRYGQHGWQHNSEMYYDEWASDAPDDVTEYLNDSNGSRDGTYYDISTTYLHQFNTEGHELRAEFDHDKHTGDGFSKNELLRDSGEIIEGRKSTESGPSVDYEFELEYTYPHGENRKFEAGYESEIEDEEETSNQYIYNANTAEYVFQPEFSRTMINKENTQSVFALYSNEFDQFGYQLGLRGEYTYRNIARPDSGNYFNLDRWDYFPTLHLSYSITEGQQLMASYSRRIDRPRGWYLEPFLTWRDAYNVSRGNPFLVPEYIDSYELGFQTRIGKSVFNFETYARRTHNKIERIQSVYPEVENVVLHSYENVGKDLSLGSEFNLRYDILKQWNVNLMGNLYHYRMQGKLQDESFDRERFNWSARFNNTIKINDVWQIQFDGMYHSPSVSAQGREKASFRSNLAVRRDFFDRKLTTILQVRDVFATYQHESTSTGDGFSSYYYRDFDSPIIMLNFKININNYRPDRSRGGPASNGEMGGEGEF